jgi:hypothetical protein
MGALLAAAAAALSTTPAAAAEVHYTDRYWQLLDRYAGVEATWAPIRGVYGESPECALAQQRGEPVACGQAIVILNPDGSFGSGWAADPAAPDGSRQPEWQDCMWPDGQLAWLCG